MAALAKRYTYLIAHRASAMLRGVKTVTRPRTKMSLQLFSRIRIRREFPPGLSQVWDAKISMESTNGHR